ncbi:unnamed protein product, partial [Allacma fusca]
DVGIDYFPDSLGGLIKSPGQPNGPPIVMYRIEASKPFIKNDRS